MASIYAEDFTGTNNDTLQATDSDWVKDSGTPNLIIYSNTCLGDSSSAVSYYRYTDADPTDADYSNKATFHCTSSLTAPAIGLRCTSDGYGYYLYHAAGTWYLWKSSGSGPEIIDSWAGDVPTTGLVGKIEASGTSLTGTVSGTSRVTGTDSDLTAKGELGLCAAYASISLSAVIDDMEGEETAGGISIPIVQHHRQRNM